VEYAKQNASGDEAVSLAIERLAVNLGKEIVSLMPGYVSTEVGAPTPHLTVTSGATRQLILRKESNSVAKWDPHDVVIHHGI
jgi:hypothetical protein